ncbi:hypothetical protein PVK06_009439 [Gossypium arboreum]|uniref:Uncharacterized protein n=1 Tax=Gossypium arboreum TaxID=29729 RepID=A0ABR0QMH2_GOSAR|nr:hypothetical protein PVK06_009439 [Gossypium arboreum]
MDEVVFDPINIELDITVDVTDDVKVEVTTSMKLKPILMGGIEKPTHLLAIAKKVSAKEIDNFDSFSSDKGNKAQVTKTSRNIEKRKLEAIIPRKIT